MLDENKFKDLGCMNGWGNDEPKEYIKCMEKCKWFKKRQIFSAVLKKDERLDQKQVPTYQTKSGKFLHLMPYSLL